MRRASFASLVALFSAYACGQSPQINYRGVVNAASFTPQGLPGGGIAQGSIFTISGRRLGPSAPLLATGFPLAATLGGVSIKVFQGAKSVDALPLFVSSSQISAVMPSNAPLGLVSVQITYNSSRSNPSPVRVVSAAFGIFTVQNSGLGPGILYAGAQNQQLNNLIATATPGQTMTVWGTGLGPIAGADNNAPPPGNLPTPVEIFVGGQKAAVQSSRRTGCCAGVDQIVFTIPSTAPQGCWVPIQVRTGGNVVSNSVTMAISSEGSPCSEPANPASQVLIPGGKIAAFLASRFSVRHDVAVPKPLEASSEYLGGYLTLVSPGPFNFNPILSLPPAGTCTTFSIPAEGPLLPGVAPTANGLNAGPLAFAGAAGSVALNALTLAGVAGAYLGGSLPAIQQLMGSLFLNPGTFTLTGGGGQDIGQFSASTNVQPTFTWTNRDQLTAVVRSDGLTVSWTGAAPGYSIVVIGMGADLPANAASAFLCMSKSGDTSLTVPPVALANIPATHIRLTQSLGAIYVGELPLGNAATIGANGLDYGFVMPSQALGKSVEFQ